MINRFVVEGRLTRDVELKKTQSGLFTVEFDVACQRNRKNDQGDYESDFFRCKAWNKLAEIISEHGKKGMRVLVEGRVQNRKYEGRDGTQKQITEVMVDNISIISQSVSKSARMDTQEEPKGNTYGPQKRVQDAQERPTDTLFYKGLYDGINEDDIPF